MPKVVVIGLDAPITKSLLRFMDEGLLPNMDNLRKNGVWCYNCLVPHPTITPPNWTTIATGAYPGTHQITCFHIPAEDGYPGSPELCMQAFRSIDVKAETLWEAGERADKRAIVINYPTTWPPKMKSGIQIGGFGLHITDWRMTEDGKGLKGWRWLINLADHQCATTQDLPLADKLVLSPCRGWRNSPNGQNLEAEVEVGKYNTLYPVHPVKLLLLIKPEEGIVEGYKDKNDEEPVFRAIRGKWSERASLRFHTEKGERDAYFKVKLLELSENGRDLKLYFTTFCSIEGATYPPELAREIEMRIDKGLPLRAMEDAVTLGWIDYETYGEILDMENIWLGETAFYLMTTKEWDIYYMHAHAPDHTYHLMINNLDHSPNEELRNRLAKLEQNFYESLDRMIGRIKEGAGEDAIIALVSDHGACPTHPQYKGVSINGILANAGLLKYKEDGRIDWERTLAFEDRSVYIWVNLKSRFPFGSVEDSDYEEVRQRIINALLSYRDPGTGRCPFAFVFRKEEAIMLGLRGERVGDVVFGMFPEAPGEHGRHITSGEYSIGSMKGLLLLSGPGIRKGVVLERQVNIADLVPTICYLTGIPVPKQCEGAVIYQALENENQPWDELHKLEEKYRKLEETIRVMRSLTHSYE
ncbi:alkaline phosphatase family protein [bacterium]|nr:alkaline phosphatase family protein [bacterium]